MGSVGQEQGGLCSVPGPSLYRRVRGLGAAPQGTFPFHYLLPDFSCFMRLPLLLSKGCWLSLRPLLWGYN